MKLTVGCWNYDRVRALFDGRVTVDGYSLEPIFLRPEETFARALGSAEFHITEMSFSNSVNAVSKRFFEYSLIPVFLSRAFRHSSLFVRTDRGIRSPADLRGKTIGLQEYDMTAAVVLRGMLREQYQVRPEDLKWKVGDKTRLKDLSFPLERRPGNVEIEILPEGRDLEDRLLAGEFDALISLNVPHAIVAGDPRVERLFKDWMAAERAYFQSTGIFPIMHAVGIRKDVLEADPALPMRLYEAFSAAKELAIKELEILQVPKVTLPWVVAQIEETRRAMGHDFWPYGMKANRRTLETQLKWSWEDGLQARPVKLEEVFAEACMGT